MKKLKTRLPKGIKGHHKMVSMILDWCSDWISQDAFDEKAFEHRPLFGKMPFPRMDGDDLILSLDQPWLHLLGLMQDCGLVRSETREDGLIWYRATPASD
jgi:hypothetical protein